MLSEQSHVFTSSVGLSTYKAKVFTNSQQSRYIMQNDMLFVISKLKSTFVVKNFYNLDVRNSMINVTVLEANIDLNMRYYIVKIISNTKIVFLSYM